MNQATSQVITTADRSVKAVTVLLHTSIPATIGLKVDVSKVKVCTTSSGMTSKN